MISKIQAAELTVGEKPAVGQSASSHSSAQGKPKLRATRQKSGMRESLLGAAVELFGSRGFEAVSLRDVTAEVGLKPPALYNHFKSKDELLMAAILFALEKFNSIVVDADDPNAPPRERLDAMVRRHILYQIENAPIAKANDRLIESAMLDRIGNPVVKRELRNMMRRYLDKLTLIMADVLTEQGDKVLDPRLCALAAGTMCDRVLVWYRPGGADTPERLAGRFAGLVRNMLNLE